MERKEKAKRSADAVETMAKFIGQTLRLDFPPQNMRVILNVPLKQLKDELTTLEAYINALK